MQLILHEKQQLWALAQHIQNQGIEVLDALIVKERKNPFIAHYVLHGGTDDEGFPILVANYKTAQYPKGGVRILPPQDILRFLRSMRLDRIRRFEGDGYEWQEALNRANEVIEQRPYDFIYNNCEHYINYVHYGNAYSQQTQIASSAVATVGLVTALASNNPWVALFGAIAFGAGAVTLGKELSKQHSFGKQENGYARTNKRYA